ncbi:uncharacterized protein LOC116852096 [Odontomachus brunneus]|uniref:uncharacterized protein LOC116852096 n=1 Tax=Odontomachus brunneus TaxID=486640 RepID=UPI0013F22DC8|nr:uncharacterized protein LOC116852096 [Odontomachus brunneus]
MKMWVYFKQMSFLAPHIAHRMSRSSVADSQQEKTMTSQSILKSSLFTEESTVKTMSSPLPSNNILNSENMLTCSDDNINNILSDNTSVSTSDQQSPVTVQDCEGNVLECVNNRMQQNKAADIVTEAVNNSIRKKKVVPAPDRFAAKRQKGMETMENVLSQSSHALNVVATAYMHRAAAAQQQEQHLYIVAINEAMKGVPDKEKITCFMSIMQVISECSRNK